MELPKEQRHSREPGSYIRAYPDGQYRDLPEVKVGWNKEEQQVEKMGSGALGPSKRSRNYLRGPVTTL
jgi:hypothetical protein